MALLFMDSFDHYATADLLEKWTSSGIGPGSNTLTITAASGRRSSGSFRLTVSAPADSSATHIRKVLVPTDTTGIVGCSIAITTAALIGANGFPILSIRDVTAPQVTLRLNADLSLSVRRGSNSGTSLGTTSAGVLAAGVAAYIELKIVIHASTGTVDLRVDGVSRLALTAQNTQNTATTNWNAVALGNVDGVGSTFTGAAGALDWDDLYVCDGTGSAPWNTLLGECRVDIRPPTGAGATTGWTPSTGANYAAVDDAVPNDDTDYTSTSTVGVTDTFIVADAPVAGGTIFGVQHCLSMKKIEAGSCTIAPVIRHAGTDYPGTAISATTSYAYTLQIAQTNPGTAAQWTESHFNAAEFGYTRTA